MDDVGDLDGLVSTWTLLEGERALVDAKRAGSRLGFALLLKSFVAHGRFPAGAADFSGEVVEFVAGQVKADPAELEGYAWSGRSAERHRAEVRGFLGFRECSVADAERLTEWLAVDVCEAERDPPRKQRPRGLRNERQAARHQSAGLGNHCRGIQACCAQTHAADEQDARDGGQLNLAHLIQPRDRLARLRHPDLTATRIKLRVGRHVTRLLR
ncbi:MAG: DUF4158 domain-containing protein [Solirubrobacteraceae bacterium]|nr:DUF4158 domain-containing protein [Solirubrobacteraceae bacterium]